MRWCRVSTRWTSLASLTRKRLQFLAPLGMCLPPERRGGVASKLHKLEGTFIRSSRHSVCVHHRDEGGGAGSCIKWRRGAGLRATRCMITTREGEKSGEHGGMAAPPMPPT